MTGATLLDGERRRLQAQAYLTGRTLEEALAAWRSDYGAPVYREGRARLARLGTMIRHLAAEAEAREDAALDHPGQRLRRRMGRVAR